MKKLILILVLSSCVVAQTNLHVNNINADGFINSIAGFEINGIAPANSFLKSNGTKYVSGSPILASADFANQGTVATVLHGNAAGNPSFGSVTGSDLNITSTICANQFVRTIGVNALGTCATVGTNDLAPSLGLVTPNVGAATGTSLNITGQYTSTLATGTPPLVVSSTTNVPNLNASTLSGKTHADPGPIGSGTPSTGAFTTFSATGLATLAGTTATSFSITKGPRDCRVSDGLVADGNTDDATALNNCLANAVTNGQSPVILPCGLIRVNSPINDTNKPSVTINGCQGNQGFSTNIGGNDYGTSQTMIVCNTRATGSGVCWDGTGSGSQHITNLSLCNNISCSGKTFTNSSNIGFLFGRDNATSGTGWITGTGTYCFDQFVVLDNVYVYFDTRPAATAVGTVAILNVGAEQFTILGGKYISDVPFFASAGNDLSIASPFQTIATGCPSSLSEIEIRQAAAFQPWTGSALNIRSALDIDMEPDTEIINPLVGTNHSPGITLTNAPFTNIWLRGQVEQFDSVLSLNGNGSTFDHVYVTMTAVSPTAGLITMNAGGTNVTNSIFAIAQRNGSVQPLFNAGTGTSTIKGSQLTEGTLSGSGAGAANVTITQSQIYAPGVADAAVNTFAAGSQYQVFDDTGNSFFGPLGTNGQITSTIATGTAPLVIASTTVVPNLNVQTIKGVTVSNAPTIGQGLIATSATAASWQAVGGAFTCVNVTPVTVNANVSTDQILMACTVPAGTLNLVGKTLSIRSAGVYSTPAASTTTVNLKVKLCTVSGCGSGTVITLASITSAALGAIQATNDPWNVVMFSSTQTAGASAAFEAHGNLTIDIAALMTAAEAVYADGNTATVGTIDSTAQLFLQVTGAFSAASASNSMTHRQLIVESVN